MAANGRQGGMYVNPLERDDMSLCSCTCYPAPKRRKKKNEIGIISRLLSRLGWTDENNSDGHYYDSETQSISNYTKLAVKRSSF
jgi:hypothetical protein